MGEAPKFLPEGATDAPPEAVWIDRGCEALAENPHLLARARLTEEYSGILDDVRAVHGRWPAGR